MKLRTITATGAGRTSRAVASAVSRAIGALNIIATTAFTASAARAAFSADASDTASASRATATAVHETGVGFDEPEESGFLLVDSDHDVTAETTVTTLTC